MADSWLDKDIFELPDQRAPAFPDEPYSAFCKVCWRNVYCLWMDKEHHHGGRCPDGHTRVDDCPEAREWFRMTGELAKCKREARKRKAAVKAKGAEVTADG